MFDSTLLPSDTTVEENRKAVLDLLAKINAVAASLGADINAVPVTPLSGRIGANTTFTLPIKTAGTQTILIPADYLVASAAGPFTLTITTGTGTTVKIPIATFGDSISSGTLLFEIYVDGSGNVTSGDWTVSGSNANGSYQHASDGTSYQTGVGSSVTISVNVGIANIYTNTTTLTFPYPFIAAPRVTPSVATASSPTSPGYVSAVSTTATTFSMIAFANGTSTATGAMYVSGRWRT